MKVLLLSNLFPTSTDPNRGLFTAQLARELAQLCDLRIAVPLPWVPSGKLAASLLPARYREFALLKPAQQVDSVRAEYPRYPLIPKLSERWHARLMQLGLASYLRKLRGRFPFDVINAHWLYPDGVAATRLGKMLGVPVVLTGLGCDVNEFLFLDDKRREIHEALSDAAAITVVSHELASVLTAAGISPAKVTTIQNGVDTRRFAPMDRLVARQQLGLPREQPLIVCISRLSHEKGIHVLVEAAAQLAQHPMKPAIVVIGEGIERESLQSRIDALGISKSMRLAGAVPHAAVATWLGAADIVCMPSLREGHPNAAMEALACGRALVASRVGALQSMITPGRGMLVPPDDAQALAAGLGECLDRSWHPIDISSSVQGDSWSAAAQRYAQVLTDAINQGHKP